MVVVLANTAVFLPVDGTPIQPVVGLLFVLFAPGYALVAALFPAGGHSPLEARHGDGSSAAHATHDHGEWALNRGIDWIERGALGFVLSLAVIPLHVLLVTLSPLAFGTTTVFAVITVWTIGMTVIAVSRRLSLPTDQRYGMTAAEFARRARQSLIGDGSRATILLNVVLVLAVVFALGSLSFALIDQPDAETYTDMALLTESVDGELTAADYPDSLAPSEEEQLFVRLENRERETTDYEVVVQLQDVEDTEDGAVVTDRTDVDRFSATLDHGESEIFERTMTIPSSPTGDELRLLVLLYEDGVPDDPTQESAYRTLHIWVDVGATRTVGG